MRFLIHYHNDDNKSCLKIYFIGNRVFALSLICSNDMISEIYIVIVSFSESKGYILGICESLVYHCLKFELIDIYQFNKIGFFLLI